MIKTADKIWVRHSLNINKVVYKVSVQHNLRTLFAALGDSMLRGTQNARRGLRKDVREAIRRKYAVDAVSRSFIANHPRWPGLNWNHIRLAVESAAKKYRQEHSPDNYARLELDEERYLAAQPEPTDPGLLH